MNRIIKLILVCSLLLTGCTLIQAGMPNGDLRVHYIDVGQGDSAFIELPGNETMLIDAGENDRGGKVVQYIKALGYEKIDYLVGTHPHSDHIGGIDDVIKSFSIGKFYMPKIAHTTKTFEDVLDACKEKGVRINTARADVNILDRDNVRADFIGPVSDHYDELNAYSAVIKLTYKNTSFLFTGDMHEENEKEILSDPSVDVLKVAHHGSGTSSSEEFISRVNPKFAVISVGEGNSYGHPHKAVIDRIDKKAQILRTDIYGTIVFASDGKKLAYITERQMKK